MNADEKLAEAQAARERILVHKNVWVKHGPMSPESLALMAAEGWTVWRATPSGTSPRSSYHHYDFVKDISDG